MIDCLHLKCRPAHVTKNLKWFRLFPLPYLFVPVHKLHSRIIFSLWSNYQHDHTRPYYMKLILHFQCLSTWPHQTVLYEIDTTLPVFIKWRVNIIWTLSLSLFRYSLEGESVPSFAVHVQLPCFFLWHSCILNSIACWASASQWIQNGLMTGIITGTVGLTL